MTIENSRHTESHTWNEILSQGEVWQSVLDGLRKSRAVEEVLQSGGDKREWLFVGCGTSYYLAEAAAISWTLLTGQRARPLPASEILLFPDLLRAEAPNLQAVVISRSGRTSEAVRAATILRNELHVPTAGITCAQNSELERTCDTSIVLRDADEQSTVMTRSFTSMLLSLQMVAARSKNNSRFVEALSAMAQRFAPRIAVLAEHMEAFVARHRLTICVSGARPFHGIAREAALKVMEMSCSYSQVFMRWNFAMDQKQSLSEKMCLTFS